MNSDLSRRRAIAAMGATGAIALAPAAFANARLDDLIVSAAAGSPVDDRMPSLSDYGRLGSGDDSSVFAAAIADAARNNTRYLRIPRGNYTVPSTITVDAPDLTIVGWGAVISSSMTSTEPLVYVTATDVKVVGLRLELTSALTTAHMFDVRADNCHVLFCDMDYTAGTSGNVIDANGFYVRDADGFQIIGCKKRGNKAFIGYFEGSNALIAYNKIEEGADDFFAIKAINRSSENIRVIGNHVRMHACLLSIGSQVGAAGADDPTYSKGVRGVVLQGNTGDACASIAVIRPGGNAANDYRDGLVEDVVISDNTLTDPAAEKFSSGLDIKCGRGSITRNIRGDNNVINARAPTSAALGRKIGAISIRQHGGGATPTIENIDVGMSFNDPYDGAAFGTAGVPGYPVENIVRIDPTNLTLGPVNLRIEGNGCSESGVLVLPGADNKITVEKLKLTNYNMKNSRRHGGFRTGSAIIVTGEDVLLSGGNGRSNVIDPGGSFRTKRPTYK